MRITVCDRCGGKIPKREVVGHIATWYEDGGEAKQAQALFSDWDICPDCMADIYVAIKASVSHERAKARSEEAGSKKEDNQGTKPAEDAKKEYKKADADKLGALEERRRKEEQEVEARGPGAAQRGSSFKDADWGKFRACIEAGKTIEWLAVEYGVSTSTIKRWKSRLKEMEKIK